MERKFKVLKNVYTNISKYTHKPLMSEGEIIEVKVLGNGIHIFDDSRFHPTWFEEWLKCGYLEEIVEDTKNIEETENVLDYNKKYNIYEAMNLLKNNDLKMVDIHDYTHWTYLEGNLYSTWSNVRIEDIWKLEEVLNMTFTLVKPEEEKDEKWIKIETNHELCTAIVKEKKIRFNGVIQKEIYNSQIPTLFDALCVGWLIEYLED
jgi:hypothetical protein